MEKLLLSLQKSLSGELHWSSKMKALYATDGSIYRELPLAVAIPKDESDIQKLIAFASSNKLSLIPRTAGTSLAGQCVGNGIVVDTSKYFTQILEINEEESWVRVQPGVIRDRLNTELKSTRLMFGPNTSTSNRAMIGGMVGNNSCGSTSISFGTTRDHTLEIKGFLSDGSPFHAKALNRQEFQEKCTQNTLEGNIYKQLNDTLSQSEVREEIKKEFPKASIHRRNTGYAIDLLANSEAFNQDGQPFNLCAMICGSEGTLAFITEIKMALVAIPPSFEALLCAHFDSIHKSMEATIDAMKCQPFACELMDRNILECTLGTPAFAHLHSFVVGDPAAVLMVEFRGNSLEEANQKALELLEILKTQAYAQPILHGKESANAWTLRAAGLGLLANLPGDEAINCIEDTAVDVNDLPAYIREFESMMHGFGQEPVYYAHAGDGELHLKPRVDLSTQSGIDLFKKICHASAVLVKKFKGSLSGEHGDGRVRAAYIPLMLGEKNYKLLQDIKYTWDPQNIFNPGKIVHALPIEANLRHQVKKQDIGLDTAFHFGGKEGFFTVADKCTGSGDCRKLPMAGGTMCPSYQATLDEQHSTRGRANALREFMSQKPDGKGIEHPELAEVMDLCIQCKGCTSECPSNVDISRLKSEYLYQTNKINGRSLRSYLFAHNDTINARFRAFASINDYLFNRSIISHFLKNLLGISPKRSIPTVSKTSLRIWFNSYKQKISSTTNKQKLIFFCDEFTDIYDVEIGIKSIQLLNSFGYEIILPVHAPSGRSQISKGFLKEAKSFAERNVSLFSSEIYDKLPIVGLEPSAILSFRDEYPDLVGEELRERAIALKSRTFLIEEFLYDSLQQGQIDTINWSSAYRKILYHGHCHQKALSDQAKAAFILSAAKNVEVEIIPSGCCGMAGSFGYEKEHYGISMKIGELVLFPTVRKLGENALIVASGTSCRHQIKDGTGKIAMHPVEVLHEYVFGKSLDCI